MDSSTNIYEKNRISYIFAQRQKKYNFNTPTEISLHKTNVSCYIIIGLLAMYIGMYIIIFSINKGTNLYP